jgi:hypothetical protein
MKPGTYEDFDSDEMSLVVGSKVVARFKDEDSVFVTLNDSYYNEIKQRLAFDDINPLDKGLISCKLSVNSQNDELLHELLDLSYESVIDTLPEQERKEILDLEW